MTEFIARVNFLSDWHIGSGSGTAEGIDRAVVRDNAGIPFVPAKSLTGILRDSCEHLLSGLFPDNPSAAEAWTTRLFGSDVSTIGDTGTHAALVWVRAARVDRATHDSIKSLGSAARTTAAALTTVKSGVSIDRVSGRAKQDHLSFTEVARPMELFASISIDSEDTTDAILLAASCRLVESIGGKRRRGLGKCTVELLHPDFSPFTPDWNELPTAAPAQRHKEQNLPKSSGLASATRTLSLTISGVTDLLFPASRQGNVTVSHDYIPGSALLRVVHQILELAGEDATTLITRGTARVSNGYPFRNGQRFLPMPLVLSAPKDAAGTFINSTGDAADLVGATKQIRGGWIAATEDGIVRLTVPMVNRTHNAIDDSVQRPTSDVGGLYTYRVIAAGQSFRALVTLPSTVVPDEGSLALLPKEASLGTSRKDDFGLVALQWEFGETPQDRDLSGDRLTIWCESDIVPDDTTAMNPLDAVASDIFSVLGVPEASASVDRERSRIRTSRTDSWHARWGLPRQSISAISKGSVIVLRVERGKLDNRRVADLESHGIGGRTTEGMGRVLVNHPVTQLDSGTFSTAVMNDGSTGNVQDEGLFVVPASSTNENFLSMVERDLLIRAVEMTATSRFASGKDVPAWTGPGTPGEDNHQFSRLRNIVRNIAVPLDPKADKAQFDHDLISWKEKASEQAWNLVSNPDAVWELLGPLSGLPESLTAEPQNLDDLKKSSWVAALRTVVETAHRWRTRSGETNRRPADG